MAKFVPALPRFCQFTTTPLSSPKILIDLFTEATADEIKDFVIHFADSGPNEPGSGGPDNNFYAEHDFRGTLKEAEEEAKKISFEKYRGDFRHWITEK